MKHLHLPDNIKVHFAGLENMNFINAISEMGVNYGLYSAFPFIVGNIKHAYDTGLRIAHTGDAIEKKSKAVLQFKEDGTFVAEYPSETEAAKKNMCKQSTISYYCRGNNKHKKMYMGYIWKYKNDVVCQD